MQDDRITAFCTHKQWRKKQSSLFMTATAAVVVVARRCTGHMCAVHFIQISLPTMCKREQFNVVQYAVVGWCDSPCMTHSLEYIALYLLKIYRPANRQTDPESERERAREMYDEFKWKIGLAGKSRFVNKRIRGKCISSSNEIHNL